MVKCFVKRRFVLDKAADQAVIDEAISEALSVPAGPVYVELASDNVEASVKVEAPRESEAAGIHTHRLFDTFAAVHAAVKRCKRPVIVIGKGVAYARAELSVQALVDHLTIPFIPMPMAKGCISDLHPMCMSSARSMALNGADLIISLAARPNWMLPLNDMTGVDHNRTIVQVDNDPGEHLMMGRKNWLNLIADVRETADVLLATSDTRSSCRWGHWIEALNRRKQYNKTQVEAKLSSESSHQLSHLAAIDILNSMKPPGTIVVNEGGNTLDIGRQLFTHESPRCRLDCGTLGAMGVGPAFAIAACLEQACPATSRQRVVMCVCGDSAFGFSAMEFETASRYQLPIVFVVLNNGYIYKRRRSSLDCGPFKDPLQLDSSSRYERIAMSFNRPGYIAWDADGLRQTFEQALQVNDGPCLINVQVDVDSGRSYQDTRLL